MRSKIKINSRYFNPATLIGIFISGFLFLLIISGLISYNVAGAITKGIVITFSGVLFFLLSGFEKRKLLFASQLIGMAVALISIFFISVHDWTVHPVDISLVNKIAESWMKIRPGSTTLILNEDIIGGVLATFIPLVFAQVLSTNKSENSKFKIVLILALLASMLGLFMTASRPAWLALIIAGIIVLFLYLSFYFKNKGPQRILKYLICLLPFFAVCFTFFLSASYDFFDKLFLSIPVSIQSRIDLYQNAYRLIEDYFYTGSGLSSFAGNYSKYILDIPNLYQAYAHNIYLDIWIEQGPLALIFFVSIMILSIVILIKGIQYADQSEKLFRAGVLAGLIVVVVNGIFEDPLYGINGTIFLFVLPGLAVTFGSDSIRSSSALKGDVNPKTFPLATVFVTALSCAGLGLSIFFFPSVRAEVKANIGSIQMADIELQGWPANPIGFYDSINLSTAQSSFEQALKFDPSNRTANQRLGLIEFRNKNFKKAVEYLEVAGGIDQAHPGIMKQLAYSYAWQGNIDEAVDLFMNFPEAKSELEVYSWWWNEQGENQLAQYANDIGRQLNN